MLKIGVRLLLACLVAYVILVLGFVWWHCYKSPLKGGANGQLDAYRHTLASAVVAYTTSPKVVSVVTNLMERKNRPANLMDRHNNAIGANIGQYASSLSELDARVDAQVANGTVNATAATQTTWLSPGYWGPGFLW